LGEDGVVEGGTSTTNMQVIVIVDTTRNTKYPYMKLMFPLVPRNAAMTEERGEGEEQSDEWKVVSYSGVRYAASTE